MQNSIVCFADAKEEYLVRFIAPRLLIRERDGGGEKERGKDNTQCSFPTDRQPAPL